MKRYFSKILVVIFITSLYSIVSCKREQESEFSLIQTGEVLEIDSTGATLYASILALGEEPILDYGFTWSKNPKPSLTNAFVISIPGTPETEVISYRLSSALREGGDYFIRSFIRNAQYTTYGREVYFTSQGGAVPVITDIFPVLGNLNDTVTILGEGFSSDPTDNKVHFGIHEAKIIYASLDSIEVLVPALLESPSSSIIVSVFSRKAVSADPYELIPPVINSIDTRGTYGSEMEIRGANFLSNPASLHVSINQNEVEIEDLKDDNLKIRVPLDLMKRNSQVRVSMNNITIAAEQEFTLERVEISDFSPKKVLTGETLTLKGSYFCPLAERNTVSIGGLEVEVVSASGHELKVFIPTQDQTIYPSRSVEIEVTVLDESRTYAETLSINDRWFRLPDSPLTKYFNDFSGGYTVANCFVHQGKAYIGLHKLPEFWLHDPGTNSWERLKDFPGDPRIFGVGFVLGDKIFFGTGTNGQKDLKDWWEYDIPTNSWTQKNDFAGQARSGAVAFQFNQEGYLGTGFQWYGLDDHLTDIWKYQPESDDWIEISRHPSPYSWFGIAVPNSSGVYIGLGEWRTEGHYEDQVYFYDPSSNQWSKINNYPTNDYGYPTVAFELNDQVYTVNGNHVHFYDESSGTWIIEPTTIHSNMNLGIGFSSGGKGYVGLGWDNHMWEFDPSR